MNTKPKDLERLERWMLQVVSHPEGIEAGVDSPEAHKIWPTGSVQEIAEDGPELDATDRLRVYADMYFWRLIDVLAGDFPCCQFILGQDEFYQVAKSYIHQYPSTSPNLASLGQHFVKFLRSMDPPTKHQEFLIDVARVERASEVCFDEAHSESISAEEFQSIAPDAWGDLSLDLIAAHRLLALDHEVDEYIQAQFEDRHHDISPPKKSWLLVYRNDHMIWRAPLSEAQYLILQTLNSGGTLLEAIEKAADLPQVDFEVLVQRVGPWFQVWTGIGLFSKICRNNHTSDE